MSGTVVKVTALHSLSSACRYDFSNCIADSTHVRFRFAEYELSESGRLRWTDRAWEKVVSAEKLFELLQPEEVD